MSKEQNQKKCDMCRGRGKIIKDWDAFEKINPYQAIGFDKREEERRINLTKKAFGICPKCGGSGKINI